ncbi:MAG: hypothetical protein WC307_04145 [Candidatus Nanoarchaeia archaeon]|jgi:hypothetical protein
MDKTKLVIILSVIGVSLVITILLINYLSAPTYNQVISQAERLMMTAGNVSINYYVSYESFINQTTSLLNGSASYSVVGSEITWGNELTNLEGTLYDLTPVELIALLKLSDTSEVVDYSSGLPCNLLNGVIIQGLSGNLIVGDYNYVRLMACLSKTTGYPLSYTLLLVNSVDGVLVTYNSLGLLSAEPKPFNESLFV